MAKRRVPEPSTPAPTPPEGHRIWCASMKRIDPPMPFDLFRRMLLWHRSTGRWVPAAEAGNLDDYGHVAVPVEATTTV